MILGVKTTLEENFKYNKKDAAATKLNALSKYYMTAETLLKGNSILSMSSDKFTDYTP